MKTLLRFQEFVDELGLSNSSNYKKEVLAKYEDDEDVRFMLHYVQSVYCEWHIERLAKSLIVCQS